MSRLIDWLWDKYDEWRLGRNPKFIIACLLIVRGMKETKMDFSKIRKIDSDELRLSSTQN